MPGELVPVRLLAPSRTTVAFLDHQNLIYVAGRSAVIFNINTQSQVFLPPRNSSFTTSTFSLSPDGQVLATLEVGPKNNIVVYEVPPPRRRKAISIQLPAKYEEYVAFAFSGDSKLLAVLLPETSSAGNSPSFSVSLYLWRTGKVLASVNLGATNNRLSPQVSFNPTDPNSIAVVYGGTLRFYRLTPDGLEAGSKPRLSGNIVTAHSWISSSRLVIGTTGSRALVLEEGDIITKIPLAETNQKTDSPPESKSVPADWSNVVGAVFPSANRICCALGSSTAVVVESQDSRGISYESLCTFHAPLIAEPTETTNQQPGLAVSRDKQQIVLSCHGKLLITKMADKTTKPIMMNELISMGHVGAVRGLSFSVWRSYAVTVGLDKNLCLWSTSQGTVLFRKEFDEEILNVTMHPTGHFVAVTTTDSVQILTILVDRFYVSKEIILAGCQKVAFNSGGNWLALSRGSAMQLINFVTFEPGPPMIAHKAEITHIAWSEDGQRLYSCGLDGLLCEWDPVTKQLRSQVKPNGSGLVTLTSLPNGNVIVAVAEGGLVELNPAGQVISRVRSLDLAATSLHYLSKDQLVLVGTRSGAVRNYKYPFGNRVDYQEYFTQTGPINQVEASADGRILISTGEDGSVCFWKLGEDPKGPWESSSIENTASAIECFVLKNDWLNLSLQLENAASQLSETKREAELRTKTSEQKFTEQLETVETKLGNELKDAERKIKDLEDRLEKEAERHHSQMAQIRTDYEAERRQLEDKHQSKLAAEYRKHVAMETQLEELEKNHDKEVKKLSEQLESKCSQIQEELKAALQQKNAEFEEKKHYLQNKIAGLEAALKMTNEKAETDQRSLQSRHETQLATEKQANLKLRGEAGILKKSIASLQREVDHQRQVTAEQQSENQRLSNSLSLLQHDLKELHEELQRKDNIIKQKDEKLSKLCTQQQLYEKSQSELKTKIDDFQRKISCLQKEMANLQTKYSQSEKNAKASQLEAERLNRTIEQLQAKSRSQSGEMQGLRHKFQNQQSRLQEILVCLDVGMTYLHDARQLKEYFAAIHEVYCGKDQGGVQYPGTKPGSPATKDQVLEKPEQLQQKVEYLENTVASLRHQLSETIKSSQQKKDKLIKDNNLLLSELERANQRHLSS